MTKDHADTGGSPKHVFMYLLMIAMLYVSVVSFITLIFQYINVSFPDPLRYLLSSYDAIRTASSSLIVAFPVYMLMSWLIRREHRIIPQTKDMRTRKWLIYFTLFIAAITIIVDLVQLMNSFYNGELTLPFALKIITVLLVASGVFWYYLADLHKERSPKITKIIASTVSFIMLATIVSGFFVAGSPQEQRRVRLDSQRVSDLQQIQYLVLDYWQKKESLPESLDDMADDITSVSVPIDPETNTAYEYKKTGDLTFTLCATFSTKSTDMRDGGQYYAPEFIAKPGAFSNDNWFHDAGRTCYDRTIDPELHRLPTR